MVVVKRLWAMLRPRAAERALRIEPIAGAAARRLSDDDIGTHLLTLMVGHQQGQDLVVRRVEQITFVGEGRFRRHVSVDFKLPHFVSDRLAELHVETAPVPIALLRKGALKRFDLRDETGASMPMWTLEETTSAGLAMLRAAVTATGRVMTPGIETALQQVVGHDGAGIQDVISVLGPDTHGGDAEEILLWLLRTFDTQFPLVTELTSPLERRRVVKYAYDDTPKVRFGGSIGAFTGWTPVELGLDVPATSFTGGSFHFELDAPPGLAITRIALERVGDDPRRPVKEDRATNPSVAHLHLTAVEAAACSRRGEHIVRVSLGLASRGVLRTSAFATAASALILLLGSMATDRLNAAQADAAVALMLIVPATVITMILRDTEHELVARLSRGVRGLTVLTGLCLYAAAAAVVLDVRDGRLRLVWQVAGFVAAVAALILLLVARRSERAHAAWLS